MKNIERDCKAICDEITEETIDRLYYQYGKKKKN